MDTACLQHQLTDAGVGEQNLGIARLHGLLQPLSCRSYGTPIWM